ncbi:hypothetical protein HY227_01200 [Candidatus Wolfebacteria bacterium]|nr:hypothetical protein [Candidatus Wolfebacteria bacterium]
MSILNPILDFFFRNLFWFEFISLIISGIMIWIIIYINVSVGLTQEMVEYWRDVWDWKGVPRRNTIKAWKQIVKRMKTGGQTQLKLAILEADRLLDEILKVSGYPGRNIEERLAAVNSAEIPNIEEVKQAHKIRNRIVAEPDFILSPGETEITIGIYRRLFIDLELIGEED